MIKIITSCFDWLVFLLGTSHVKTNLFISSSLHLFLLFISSSLPSLLPSFFLPSSFLLPSFPLSPFGATGVLFFLLGHRIEILGIKVKKFFFLSSPLHLLFLVCLSPCDLTIEVGFLDQEIRTPKWSLLRTPTFSVARKKSGVRSNARDLEVILKIGLQIRKNWTEITLDHNSDHHDHDHD